MTSRKLGFYKELDYGDANSPSIKDRQVLESPVKDRVLRYLETAPVIAAAPSSAIDYFTGAVLMPKEFRTDGTWVWFSELPHYVRHYDTVLDPAFIAVVMSCDRLSVSKKQLNEVIGSLGSLA